MKCHREEEEKRQWTANIAPPPPSVVFCRSPSNKYLLLEDYLKRQREEEEKRQWTVTMTPALMIEFFNGNPVAHFYDKVRFSAVTLSCFFSLIRILESGNTGLRFGSLFGGNLPSSYFRKRRLSGKSNKNFREMCVFVLIYIILGSRSVKYC